MQEQKENRKWSKFPRTVNLKTAIALILIAVTLTSTISYYVFAATPSFPTVISPGSMTDTATYVIFKDGLTVYAKNGKTGQIEFTGTPIYTIQAAINALPEGGKIFIKAGTYIIDNIIRIMKNNITIEGEGCATCLHLQDAMNAPLIVIDAVTAKKSIEGVTLCNFLVDGNRPKQTSGSHGIYLKGNETYGVFSCVLHDLRIMYCYFAGIYAEYTSEIHYANLELGWNYNNLEIHHSSESRIENVVVSCGYQDGIQIIDSSDICLEANCEFQTRYGILIQDSNFTQINAILYYNKRDGLKLDGALRNTIEVISRANSQDGDGFYDGINLYDSLYNIVSNSQLFGENSTKRLRWGLCEEGTSDYNVVISVNARDNVAWGGIKKIGVNTKVNLCWNGTAWIP